MRNRTFLILASLSLVAVTTAPPKAAERHIRADLVSSSGSGSHVSGFVDLTQLPHGGSMVHVVVHGLDPGTTYASFYYESSDCSAPADLLGTFTGGPNGTGEIHGKIDDDLDEVGSVSVRLGPDYGTLMACAATH
jgi:hypothetical protein